MASFNIAVIAGSLRKESHNRKLANGLIKLGPADFVFKMIEIGDLPLYNQDHDSNQHDTVKKLKEEISASQGVIFVTPEYNRSVPGVLKNAIDHASRPYGKNVWDKKPAGVLGVSPGAISTAAAQQHLRNILVAVNMPVLPQPEVFIKMSDDLFNADGTIGDKSKKFLQSWMDAFAAWVKKHA